MTRSPAGKRNKRGELFNPADPNTANVNSGNEVTDNPTSLGTFWMAIEQTSGNELLAAQQVVGVGALKVTMDYVAAVTPATWIQRGTRRLDIAAVLNVDEDNWEMTLLCSERK